MKAIRSLLIFIFSGCFIFFLFGWHSGFFSKATIEIKDVGPYYAIYEDHTGEYSETVTIQEKLFGLLWDSGIENYKNFAIFFDDPKTAEISTMRSKVGRIIRNDQFDELNQLPPVFQQYKFPRQKAAVIRLQYVNSFSLYAGIYKAYPRLKDFAHENGFVDGPVIEINEPEFEMLFILPLIKKQ